MENNIDIIEVIETYNDYLNKIPTGLNYIINHLRDGNIDIALKSVIDFSEGIVWMNEVAQHLNSVNYNVDFNVKEIEGFLEEINSGLQKGDFLLVSDIFEYELLEFFSNLSPIKYNN